MRAKDIEKARGTGQVPWGVALSEVLKEFAHIWQETRHLLLKTHTFSEWGIDNRAGAAKPNGKKGKGGGKAKGGKPACNRFNSKGGCRLASCSFQHICNQRLASGSICGSKNHSRSQHDPSKHGKPMMRP